MTIIRGESVVQKMTLTAERELVPVENAMQTALDLIQTVAEKLSEENKSLLDKLRPEIVQCIIRICEKIIYKELKDPETMRNLIDSLLDRAISHGCHGVFYVFLSSEDKRMLDGTLSKNISSKEGVSNLQFRVAFDLKRGQCRIENEVGVLNYSIERELLNFQSSMDFIDVK